jgi:hypothetical protein
MRSVVKRKIESILCVHMRSIAYIRKHTRYHLANPSYLSPQTPLLLGTCCYNSLSLAPRDPVACMQDESRGMVHIGDLAFGPEDQYLLLSGGLDVEEQALGGMGLGSQLQAPVTGCGDGLFPVSCQRDTAGALWRVTVLFLGM